MKPRRDPLSQTDSEVGILVAATLLGDTPTGVVGLIKAGHLPARRAGPDKKTAIRVSDLLALKRRLRELSRHGR